MPHTSVHSKFVQFLLTVFQVAVACLIVGLVWGGWYLHNKGFSRSIRDRLSAEFARQGVDIKMRRLTLDPFQGLVAQDMKVYDQSPEPQVLAEISHVALDINIGGLLRGDSFLNAIDLRSTRLTIPVDPTSKKSPRMEVDGLSARVVFPPGQIHVTQAEGVVAGIRISLKGTLVNPDAYVAREGGDPERSRRMLARCVEELGKLKFEGRQPSIEVEFGGDLAHPESLRVEKVTVKGETIRRELVNLRSLDAQFSMVDGIVQVHRFVAEDVKGRLDLAGRCDIRSGRGEFWLESSVNLQTWADEIFGRKMLAELTFFDAPVVDAHCTFELKPELSFLATGSAKLKRFGARSVIFDGLEAKFSADRHRVLVDGLSIRHRSGNLRASLLNAPGDFRVELRSSLDPSTLGPIFGGKVMVLLGEWTFEDSPQISLSASGISARTQDLQIEGDIRLGSSTYRGLHLKSLTTPVRFRDGAATYPGFQIVRDQGQGTGTFVYDFGRGEARLEKIVTTIHPSDALHWVNPKLVKSVEPYRFKVPPKLQIDGKVQMGTAKGTNLRILVDSPKGMDYKFMGKDLNFDSIRGRLDIEGRMLNIRDLQASLMGGEVTGSAEISIDRDKPGHHAIVRLGDVDFQGLTRLYFGYEASKGRLDGSYEFTGSGSNVMAMSGVGDMEVEQGNVFAIPFLGPLSGLINEIVPGMGYSVARKATANFTIKEGVIRTDDFIVDSNGFVMRGAGWLGMVEDKMDFSVRINAKGIPGVLLFPVSKLFEYVSDGKRSEPTWRPKRLPKELFRR